MKKICVLTHITELSTHTFQKLLITNCETRYSVLKAPPQLEWLRLYDVQRDPYGVGWFDPLGVPRNCFELAPSKRFLPLVVNVSEPFNGGKIRHSTLGYRFVGNDKMLAW